MSRHRKSSPSAITMTGSHIRQSFLDFFAARGHAVVPSASLVPGSDPTLLFTNSGMVQFKDVFLGTGSRPYSRAVDSQKCMRVAGKHNDLEDVGRDDFHHTFFEMLGNWSFGDYYKAEAIAWAWELLTEEWGLPKAALWATCFEDDLGDIPRDDEAADIWRGQPGFQQDHVLFFGRSDNFWEMADVGPCGPDSEVHIDRGPQFCDRQGVPGHVCKVNGDCSRFLELWNLVFIQYNRSGPNDLKPLPRKHVDTGLGLERVVSVLQGVSSNYRTDLLLPLMRRVQQLAGHDDQALEANLTPYRVIADHSRAAAFLIADGVVPGNVGRNYVCRMIVRRASRFGMKLGFDGPFLAPVAETVIDEYGSAYPELPANKTAILRTLNEEEKRFRSTVDTGLSHLTSLLDEVTSSGSRVVDGSSAFSLYATFGLPFEITRDVAQEQGISTDEAGFWKAMEEHRIASGAGKAMGEMAEENIDFYQALLDRLRSTNELGPDGVVYDPYAPTSFDGRVLAIIRDGHSVPDAAAGNEIGIVLPRTSFYLEAGGQVTDKGTIRSLSGHDWLLTVEAVQRPVEGLIVHVGNVVSGSPRVGDRATGQVDQERRLDIMRNHTATHLLHASLRAVLGNHARQAGSLVAPERLRFDFTHPQAMSSEEIQRVERMVNESILANLPLRIRLKSRAEAVAEGATALFGETYGETVRTVAIGDEELISYELCGGTHVPETGVIGPFLILSEGSAAAGIRRIEAATGREALRRIRDERASLRAMADKLGTSQDLVEQRVLEIVKDREDLEKQLAGLRARLAEAYYRGLKPETWAGVQVLTGVIPDASSDVLRNLLDQFRNEHPSGVAALGSVFEGRPLLVALVTQDLVSRGLHAGELARVAAAPMGGSGGGKPTLAQAGGKDPGRLEEALSAARDWVRSKLAWAAARG